MEGSALFGENVGALVDWVAAAVDRRAGDRERPRQRGVSERGVLGGINLPDRAPALAGVSVLQNEVGVPIDEDGGLACGVQLDWVLVRSA